MAPHDPSSAVAPDLETPHPSDRAVRAEVPDDNEAAAPAETGDDVALVHSKKRSRGRAALGLAMAPARFAHWLTVGFWDWVRLEGRFWALSVIGHCTGLILIGLIMGVKAPPAVLGDPVVFEAMTVLDPPEMATVELSVTTERSKVLVGDDDGRSGGGGGGYSVAGLPIGHGTSMEGGGVVGLSADVGESVEGTAIGLKDVGVFGVGGGTLALETGPNAPGEPSRAVDNLDQAMDHITQEILMALLKGDVLVMWLFDQSESMRDDQKEIRDRFDRVYDELGLSERVKGDALLTAIGSFGKDFMLHTEKPTQDLKVIRAAIDAVPLDASGYENTFPAIGQMINLHRKFALGGHRQLMLICVTDESGEPESNVVNLEPAISEAKAARCPVFFMGREAVFGYPWAYMAWTDPGSQNGYWLPINRGPESPDPEQLQTDGFRRRYDAFASGFGPYEQTRCARETGGIFFLLPSPEVNLVGADNRKYAIEQMRPYLPDLGPRADYIRQRDKSELRSTIWKVISDLNPYNDKIAPHIEMRLTFSLDRSAFSQEVAAEHERAKQYFLYLHAAEQAMEKLQKRRDNEISPRWRANYDLIYAQLIAYKVRLYEYGASLEDFLKNPKPIKNPYKDAKGFPVKSNYWAITTRADMLTLDTTGEYLARSKEMFAKIMKDYAGTPWAARAEWELARGFGVDIIEAYDAPARPVSAGFKLPKL